MLILDTKICYWFPEWIQNNQLYRFYPTMFQDQNARRKSLLLGILLFVVVTITNLTKLFITYISNMLFITRNDSLTHRSLVLFSNKFPFQNCRVTCFLFFFFIFSPELGFHYVKGLHIFSSHSIQDSNAKVIIKGQFSRKSYLTIALVLNWIFLEVLLKNCYSEKDTETLAWNTDTWYEEEG